MDDYFAVEKSVVCSATSCARATATATVLATTMRKMNQTIVVAMLLVVVAVPLWLWVWRCLRMAQRKQTPRNVTPGNSSIINSHCRIPFIHVSPESPHPVILASLAQFRTEAHQAMHGLSAALEKALDLEINYSSTELPENIRLSRGLQSRIETASRCLEEQQIVLERLLTNPGYHPTMALPETERLDSPSREKNDSSFSLLSSAAKTAQKMFTRPPPSSSWGGQSKRQSDDNAAYDSSFQIVAHLVRDWTTLGGKVRQSIYGWCVQQVEHHISCKTSAGSILVPGAGMGRLAFNLASLGYVVEANELSPVMAAAAQALLQWNVSGHIYPYLLDRMANEVNPHDRFTTVPFPDVSSPIPATTHATSLSLSYTIGDFVGPYYQARSKSFGAVVTCFFLDTATNVYDYLDLIFSLLIPQGIWINVGPLQWHINAMLVPSVDELRLLIASRFIIHSWSIDTEPIPYRDTEHVTTHFDGYRPLRFVAIRK